MCTIAIRIHTCYHLSYHNRASNTLSDTHSIHMTSNQQIGSSPPQQHYAQFAFKKLFTCQQINWYKKCHWTCQLQSFITIYPCCTTLLWFQYYFKFKECRLHIKTFHRSNIKLPSYRFILLPNLLVAHTSTQWMKFKEITSSRHQV